MKGMHSICNLTNEGSLNCTSAIPSGLAVHVVQICLLQMPVDNVVGRHDVAILEAQLCNVSSHVEHVLVGDELEFLL